MKEETFVENEDFSVSRTFCVFHLFNNRCSDTFRSQVGDEELTYLQTLSNEVDMILAEPEESKVPDQK